MMTDEELSLFIENLKKELEADPSQVAYACPCCEQLLSPAAAERIQKLKEREAQSN
jgi:transcription initiation factor IIE alpha subunit